MHSHERLLVTAVVVDDDDGMRVMILMIFRSKERS